MKTTKTNKNSKIILFLIILFGLALRLIFFSGMGLSDELTYSKTAYYIGQGIDMDSVLTLSTRLGLIYPTAFFYGLFGVNDISSVLFVFLTSIGFIVLVYFFGKLLFNERVAIIAAFLTSIFPLEIVYSTKLVSDLPSAFFMSLGIYFFLYSEMKSKLKFIGCLLAGIFIGIGYLIRESALLIALFFLIYVIYRRKIRKQYFLVAFGFLLVFFAEMWLFSMLTNDPFFRFHASQQYFEEKTLGHNGFGRLDFPTGLLHYPYLIMTNPLISFFYTFIFIALFYCFRERKKESYLMLIWFSPLLLYLSFGSGSLTSYVPFRAVDRYLSIITMPGILILSFFLAEKKDVIQKIIMPSALVVLLIFSIGSSYVYHNRHIKDNIIELYSHVKNLDRPVYIDRKAMKALQYVSGYQLKADIREYPRDLKNIRDSYVVIDKETIGYIKEANKDFVFPEEIENPPGNWKLISKIGISEDKQSLIYYVP